jgi:protein subunit release factor B
LFDKIEKLGVDLNDIEESFVRGSGAGGQKINKTSNKVQMLHKGTTRTNPNQFSHCQIMLSLVSNSKGQAQACRSAASESGSGRRIDS